MINKKFEAYKIRREIKRSGNDFIFYRSIKNDYGEPSSEKEIIAVVSGLYHEQSNYISIKTGETTRYRTKKTPMLLCEYSDVVSLKADDFMILNENKYTVTKKINVQEWNIISDISLEVEDNGI